MKTIEIDGKSYLIDIKKATEQGLLKEQDSKPHSWEEYETAWVVMPGAGGNVNYASDYNNDDSLTYDIFNSEEEAHAFCALGKLIQLRDAWWGDWKPDWKKAQKKYHIYVHDTNVCIDGSVYIQHTFTFPSQEMATDFLKTFRDLIEQAKMFL